MPHRVHRSEHDVLISQPALSDPRRFKSTLFAGVIFHAFVDNPVRDGRWEFWLASEAISVRFPVLVKVYRTVVPFLYQSPACWVTGDYIEFTLSVFRHSKAFRCNFVDVGHFPRIFGV